MFIRIDISGFPHTRGMPRRAPLRHRSCIRLLKPFVP